MNLADAEDIQRGVPTVLREHGGVDILIHAAVRHFAGDDGHEGRAFAHHSPQQVMETLAVNVTGPTLLTQLLCQGMSERRWGRIVLVGSMHRSGTPGLVMYAAGKAFLNTLARGLFLELREHNIVVSVANPGGMNTALHGFRYPWMLDPAVVAETIVGFLELPEGVAALSFEMVPHDPEHPDAF
jgi:NAD(P)-dependent dehydrogenase (short-subunit alcohol dehydrogenase family)